MFSSKYLSALACVTTLLPSAWALPTAPEHGVGINGSTVSVEAIWASGERAPLSARAAAPAWCTPPGVDASNNFYYYDESNDCARQGFGTHCCMTMLGGGRCGKDLTLADIEDLKSVVATQASKEHWYETASKGIWAAGFVPFRHTGTFNKNVLTLWFHDINYFKAALKGSADLDKLYFDYEADGAFIDISVIRIC